MAEQEPLHPLSNDRRCPACAVAERQPLHAIYYSGCPTCDVRSISQAPRHIREQFYASLTDSEERDAFIEAVALEFRRRRPMMVSLEEAE